MDVIDLVKELDEQQRQAVLTTGKSVVVSASAGAGKTKVLVSRLTKRVLIDRIPVSRIIALTFTKAAAEEMKKRVAASLNNALISETDPKTIKYLGEQIVGLESAQITTIHSFCLNIIEKYYNVIGLNPAITSNTITEGQASLLYKEAFNEAFKEMYKNEHDNLLNLSMSLSNRSEDYSTLIDTITSINNKANSSMSLDKWYADARNRFKEVNSFKEIETDIKDNFFNYFKLQLATIKTYLDVMTSETDNQEKLVDACLKLNVLLENAENKLNEDGFDLFGDALAEFASFSTPRATTSLIKTDAFKTADESRKKKAKELLLISYPKDIYLKDHNSSINNGLTLLKLAELTSAKFSEIKQREGCIDFSDMERLANKILVANDYTVANILKDSLDEIMVDEFQDTSDLQNQIIELISKKDNVFRVGDIKQSIYRFRDAKPSLMRSLMNDESYERITFRHNFRSKQSVVDFNNYLYERLMNIPECLDRYSELDHQLTGAAYQKEETKSYIEFINVLKREDEKASSASLKANYIAQKILELHKNHDFKDFCVLVKSHRNKVDLKIAFDAYDIPYNIDTKDGFFNSIVCQDINAVIKAALEDNNDIALVSTLTSSIYNLSDVDLANLKIKYKSLREGVEKEYPAIINDLKELKEVANKEDVYALISKIAATNGYYETLDDVSKANFDFLFEKAISSSIYEANDFLALISSSTEEKSSEASSVGKDDDVVGVTTIHHSKGLEYPIVFLWGTEIAKDNDKVNTVMVDQDLHLGMYAYDFPYRVKRKTISRLAIEYKNNREELEENTRVLYVATTRAKDKLYIVDNYSKDTSSKTLSLAVLNQRSGISGLILSAMGDKDNEVYKYKTAYLDSVAKYTQQTNRYVDKLPEFKKEVKIFPKSYTPSSTEVVTLPSLELDKTSSNTSYGTLMHKAVELLPNRVVEVSEVLADGLSLKDKTKISNFTKTSLFNECLKGTIHKEFPFYVERDNFRINGIMDFISIMDNKVILIDFKTDHAEIDEIRNRYQEQLNTYRLALKEIYQNKKIEVYAYSFYNEEAILIKE